MIIDVIMPKMGESITEGTILEWYKEVGEAINKDETLLEIGTDKVDSEIPSPGTGTVIEILAKSNDVIDVGEVIAKIETSDISVKLNSVSDKKIDIGKEKSLNENYKENPPKRDIKSEKSTKAIKLESGSNNSIITPAVTTLANQEGIAFNDLVQIIGTGKNGRITKKDLETFIDQMTPEQLKSVMDFFDTMPKLRHAIQVTNPNTKNKGEVVVEGLQNFLE